MRPVAWLGIAAVASAAAGAADIPAADRSSGYDFMGPELRAMQDDEAANPGMLSVLDGAALWQQAEGVAHKS